MRTTRTTRRIKMKKISDSEWAAVNKVILSIFQHFSQETFDAQGNPIRYPAAYLQAAWPGLVDKICGPGAAIVNFPLKAFFKNAEVQRDGKKTYYTLTFDVAGYLTSRGYVPSIVGYTINLLGNPGEGGFCGMLDLRGVNHDGAPLGTGNSNHAILDKNKSLSSSRQTSISSMFARAAMPPAPPALPMPVALVSVVSVVPAEPTDSSASGSSKHSDLGGSDLSSPITSPSIDRSSPPSSSLPSTELTLEQLERIKTNREAALKRRREYEEQEQEQEQIENLERRDDKYNKYRRVALPAIPDSEISLSKSLSSSSSGAVAQLLRQAGGSSEHDERISRQERDDDDDDYDDKAETQPVVVVYQQPSPQKPSSQIVPLSPSRANQMLRISSDQTKKTAASSFFGGPPAGKENRPCDTRGKGTNSQAPDFVTANEFLQLLRGQGK